MKEQVIIGLIVAIIGGIIVFIFQKTYTERSNCKNFKSISAVAYSKSESTPNIVNKHCEGQVISNSSNRLAGNVVAYDISNLCRGKYEIEVEYASPDQRLLEVFVNDESFGHHFGKSTNSLCSTIKEKFLIEVKKNSDLLIFRTNGVIPHIKLLTISQWQLF